MIIERKHPHARAIVAAAAIVGVGSVFGAGPAAATTLSFDDLALPDYGDIPNTYGDRFAAGGTPNVEVDYFTRSAGDAVLFDHLDFWNNDYGDLTKVAFSVENGAFAEIVLRPDPGFAVWLAGFDMAGWFRTDRFAEIFVRYGATELDLSTTVEGDNGHSSFAPNVTYGGPVTVRWGTDWNVGIDNLSFRQVACTPNIPGCEPGKVSDPGTLALLGLGLAGLGLGRRRRG